MFNSERGLCFTTHSKFLYNPQTCIHSPPMGFTQGILPAPPTDPSPICKYLCYLAAFLLPRIVLLLLHYSLVITLTSNPATSPKDLDMGIYC